MILKEFYDYQRSLNPDNKEWLEWARMKLEWYNPAQEITDDLMEDIDKDTLELKKKNYWH